jgi:Fe-S oxidoreductase
MKKSVDHRTLEDKIAYVRQHGNHSSPARMRKMMMQNLSFHPPKASAEYAIVFGCYSLYSNHTRLLKAYTNLLEHFGVDYTFLKNEFCCGSPLVQTSKRSERNQAKNAAGDFLQMNIQQAIEQNVKKIAYFCSSCARIANSLIKDDTIEHIYLLDLILDHMDTSQLRSGPATVGYFEGCHATIDRFFTDANLPWKRYRMVLGRIHGLDIVDLPSDVCCRGRSEHILETLRKRNLSVVICSCNNCVRFLEKKAGAGIQVKHMVEIISDTLVKI